MAARKPVKSKPAKKPAAKATKAAASRARPRPAASASLASQLASALRLDEDVVLERALRSFAAAHGVALADAPAVEAAALPAPVEQRPVAPVPAPAKKSRAEKEAKPAPNAPGGKEPDPGEVGEGSLLPPIRVFVQTKGRPAIEMVNEQYTVGSNNKCDLWINQPRIDTRHVRIFRHGGKCYVEDLNTQHNTKLHSDWIGGKGPVELHHEDTVYLAGYHPVRVYLHRGVR